MREYGKVHSSFWSSASIRNLSEDGRTLALYLLTCSHSTIAGVFRLPDGYACEDLQWSTERVREGFAELFRNGFANRCETTKWVWVCKHFDWNQPENPNQRKAASKVAHQVPDACVWIHEYKRVCWQFLDLPRPEEPNPSGTVPKPFRNQEQEQEQEEAPLTPQQGGAIVPVASRRKSAGVTLKTFLEACAVDGVKPIGDADPIFEYAEKVGIDHEMLVVAWLEFKQKHLSSNNLQKDWPAHFRNTVRRNWLNLWFLKEGEQARWTTAGEQARRAAA